MLGLFELDCDIVKCFNDKLSLLLKFRYLSVNPVTFYY